MLIITYDAGGVILPKASFNSQLMMVALPTLISGDLSCFLMYQAPGQAVVYVTSEINMIVFIFTG